VGKKKDQKTFQLTLLVSPHSNKTLSSRLRAPSKAQYLISADPLDGCNLEVNLFGTTLSSLSLLLPFHMANMIFIGWLKNKGKGKVVSVLN
jgi:fructose-1,6-bisphosphatase